MTNNELALAFAREVMGWEDAELVVNNTVWESCIRRGAARMKSSTTFDPTVMEEILRIVQEWCDTHGSHLSLNRECNNGGWWVRLKPKTIWVGYPALSSGKDLATTLMTACLEAERKRRRDGNS